MEKRPQTKVKVVVRLRPTLSPKDKPYVSIKGKRVQILNHRNIGENFQYEFHTVFDEKASQEQIFSDSVEPLLKNVLHGQNVSVFAYGPTGAGKTHTMLGTALDPGIIPRVIKALFKLIKAEEISGGQDSKQNPEFKVTFSYLEIYNEKVHDLLTPSQQDLPIREDASHNIFVADLTEQRVDGFDAFKNHFEPAASNRTVGATKLNACSSRSHTLLMIKVRRKEPGGKELRGKLYLIDLAGSEDNRRTGNMGIRLKESGAINKSLFVLGEVVDAINNNLTRVPYRNSKLTRLLQDSIGGSCHSVMITNIAPEERFYYDTYCTLNFATKSKKIVNTVTVDEVRPIEKPTAAVKPIKRRSVSLPPPRPKSSRRSSSSTSTATSSTTSSSSDNKQYKPSLASSTSVSSLESWPSPLVRRQQAFETDMMEKISNMERLMEQLQQQNSSKQEVELKDLGLSSLLSEPSEPSQAKKSIDLSLVSVESQDSPDVVCPTPNRKLKDATNLLIKRHFGPQREKVKKLKMMSRVVDDDTSCSPLFPKPRQKSVATKRGSSGDFESPTLKKIKSVSEKCNKAGQMKRNDDFLALLNSATVKELQQLQTVGVKKAKLIFDWREMHGPFTVTDDVLNVPGFTEKSLKKLLLSNFVTDA